MNWTNPRPVASRNWRRFDHIDVGEAARRLAGIVRRTPLTPLPCDNPRLELRGKMENEQVIGAFKARGAWNQVSRLTEEQRRAGVVCPSSGNHGKALAWAAQRAGIRATVVMPEDAYPNKVEACRSYGAEVVLAPSRQASDDECLARVEAGAILIHPYDSERTIQGAGTVGLEIAEQWPEVEVVVVPVGGGGLLAGTSLGLRQRLPDGPRVLGVEPAGAPSMSLGLERGEPVRLGEITTGIQGLCPPFSGRTNIDICLETVDRMITLDDDEILSSQARLVADGRMVEPAGAAAAAAVLSGHLPDDWLEARDDRGPLRVAVVVSGGNADPEQIEAIRAGTR